MGAQIPLTGRKCRGRAGLRPQSAHRPRDAPSCGRQGERGEAASTSEMNRFETEILTTRKNLKSLMDVPGKWIDRVRQHRFLDKLILDLISSVSETYGRRERHAAQRRREAPSGCSGVLGRVPYDRQSFSASESAN